MSVVKSLYFENANVKVNSFTIANKNGTKAVIIEKGATLEKLFIKTKNGDFVDVLSGHDTFKGHTERSDYQGVVVGQYANRIKGGKFSIDSVEYNLTKNDNGITCLHGGGEYSSAIWNGEITGDKAVISGSIYYNILYLSRVEDEETGERISTPFMYQGKTDFTQFTTLSSANGQSGAKVAFDDSDLAIKIRQPGAGTASEDDDYEEDFERDEIVPKTPYFAMEGNLEVAIEVFRNVESEVATDMYCIDKELTFETEDFVSDAVEGTGSVEIQAREIVNVPDGTGDVDRVIFVSGKVRDCDSVSEYGKENVSGMIEAEMIVLPEDKKEKPVKLNY